MIRSFYRRLLQHLPSSVRDRLNSWKVSSEFRKCYLDWRLKGGRSTDMRHQEVLRRAFISNGFQDLDWALNLEKERRPLSTDCDQQTADQTAHLTQSEIAEAVATLRQQGVWICPRPLPQAWVHRVRDALSRLPVEGKGSAADVQFPLTITPRSATYWHRSVDLEKNQDLVTLMQDESIRHVIRQYLGLNPVFDMCTAWWSYPSSADAASAQMFHFDLDRVRWLKVFVYLTPVGPDNGPHVFVKGSHRTVGSRIHRDGRYSDEEAKAIFPDHEFAELTGEAGTLFIEDTIGFHKGTAVRANHRCVFEFEYSVSHFGYPYPSSTLDASDE